MAAKTQALKSLPQKTKTVRISDMAKVTVSYQGAPPKVEKTFDGLIISFPKNNPVKKRLTKKERLDREAEAETQLILNDPEALAAIEEDMANPDDMTHFVDEETHLKFVRKRLAFLKRQSLKKNT
jgi:hypothetical protein